MIFFSFGKFGLVLQYLSGVLILIGLGGYFYVVPLNARLHVDREKVFAALNTEMDRVYKLPNDVEMARGGQQSRFENLSVVLADLQTTSSRTALIVLDATCRPIETKEKTAFGQVQISTRMKGNYKDIKNVISKLLAAHEGLSLDTLSFRRARATDPQLDAEVRMTFYYKKDA